MLQSVLNEKIEVYFTAQLVDQLAKQSGEEAFKIEKAIRASIAISTYQFAQKIQQKEPARALYILSRVAFGAKMKNMLPHMFRGSAHFRGLLNMANVLFGDQLKAVNQWLSKETGLNEARSGATLKMVVPVILSAFGEVIKTKRLTQSGYVSYMSQYDELIQRKANEIELLPYYLLENGSESRSRSSAKSNQDNHSSAKTRLSPLNLSLRMLKWSGAVIVGVLAFVYKIIQ